MYKLIILLFVLFCMADVSAQEKPYLGAEIRTAETFLYGKFEVRMKTAAASGLIYSFFTFYDEPDFATKWNEIDVEILGRYENEIQFNAITGNHTMHEKRHVVDFNPHDAFHVYAFEWTPDYIAWFVDSVEVYRQAGDYVKTMNRAQKLMMNVWPSSSVAWAGKIDAAAIPLQAEYDFINYYAYNPSNADTFQLKWTDNFDYYDNSRWQKATHTFDTNECVFEPDNSVVEAGYLKLRLTKPEDDSDVQQVPLNLIKSATCVANTSAKYIEYIALKVEFYQPVNRMFYKPEYFSVSQGTIKHMYFDVDRKYVLIYVGDVNVKQLKAAILSYTPTKPLTEQHAQDLPIK